MSKKKTTDIISQNTEVDEDEGGSQTQIEESYVTILKALGIEVKDLSLEDIRKIIHEYAQSGNKSTKLIDFKTRKAKEQTVMKQSERTYQVKQSQDKPMSPEEAKAMLKEKDYQEKSDRQDVPDPQPPFNPKPKI